MRTRRKRTALDDNLLFDANEKEKNNIRHFIYFIVII